MSGLSGPMIVMNIAATYTTLTATFG